MDFAAVDLFCGAGGLTHGLEQAGIDVQIGVDTDPQAKHAYNVNNDAEFRQLDVTALAQNPDHIKRMYPWQSDYTILTACAPCQPYSTLSHSKDKSTSDHEKWGLLNTVSKIVSEVEPDVLVTENVLQVRNDGVYDKFVNTLEANGYTLNDESNRNVYCPEYGIAQNRKRWVIIASKHGKINLPEPPCPTEADYPTVRETIGHLPAIDAGEVHPDNDLHRARTLNETNLERIRHMEPGGDWRLWEEEGLKHLLADCHKRASGKSYKAPYSRMEPNKPAPTITTQFYNYGSGRFGHYDTTQDRALSLLEGALLQSFPEDYEFYENWDDLGVKNIGRLIGNAVPPRLAEYVGHAIRNALAPEAAEPAATPATTD